MEKLYNSWAAARALFVRGVLFMHAPVRKAMKFRLLVLGILLVLQRTPLSAAGLRLAAPVDFQVVQRESPLSGHVTLEGSLSDMQVENTVLEARIVDGGKSGAWQRISAVFNGPTFSGRMEIPAGGWFRLEARISKGAGVLAQTTVEHVGVGEVFVIAGQSNSGNYGEEKQTSKTGKVASFDGARWQIANDPQPGAGGNGGSFMAPFGDAISVRFGVPVGIIACGIGSTSVREWLPKGCKFPNPPTLVGRVRQVSDNQWESKGEAFEKLVTRMKQAGPHGFRAVLWHQGESDANQQDPTRTLPGNLYHDYLETIIHESRRRTEFEAPWFVAQASYHSSSDTGSPEIRAAQAKLWKEGIALEGPDSDALTGNLREKNGAGVHFSGPGLREHGVRWANKVGPWLQEQLRARN